MSEIKNNASLTKQEKKLAKQNAALAKKLARRRGKIKESLGDRILLGFTTCVLILVMIIVGYPVLYVISSSFSSDAALSTGRVVLFPVEPSMSAYKYVFQFDALWQGYKMTIFYTIFGTSITMFMQILAAYPLSRPKYQGRGLIMTIFFVTTMVGAGMIPTLLLRKAMGLYNNVFAVLLAGVLSVHNMIILRTSFRSSIPGELYDAAAIDGASDFQTLFKIALPLTKATLSVLTLYSAVGNWNEYFTSMIYLPGHKEWWPLQLVLRDIMSGKQKMEDTGMVSIADATKMLETGSEGRTFAIIVLTTVPVLLMYFVVQKYFEKGVMVGSVKG